MTFPTRHDHLNNLSLAGEVTIVASSAALQEWSREVDLIGTALSALFQAATCHRGCSGGSHLLEALAGRSYNLGAAAHTVIIRGFYDEGLLLIRSIGEIANLIAMSSTDKDAIQEWISSDGKTRRNKFSPSKVRKMLAKPEHDHPHFDDEWYSRLSEDYTHVTPAMKPNAHDNAAQGNVGGKFQRTGLENALGELATVLGFTSLMICAFFKFDDLFAEISSLVDMIDSETAEI